MTEGVADTALRVGDLQAVIPALATQAIVEVGLEDDAGAVATIRQAIERRGDIREAALSAWLAFESADALTAVSLREPESPALRDGLELVASFCTRIAPVVLARGDLVQVEVRQALFGAAVEQLASLAQRAGVPVSLPDAEVIGRSAALSILDREHRPFDAARIRLWLAEEKGGSQELALPSRRSTSLARIRTWLGRIGSVQRLGEGGYVIRPGGRGTSDVKHRNCVTRARCGPVFVPVTARHWPAVTPNLIH